MDVLCIFKINRERAKFQNMGVSKTSDHIPIKIKMLNPSEEPPVSSKAPNDDLKDMDVLCTFKIKIEPKFGLWVYHRAVSISILRSRCQTPVRNVQHPLKPHIRT